MKNNFFSRIISVFIGIFIAILLLEIFLRLGNFLFIRSNFHKTLADSGRLFIFAGDSWTFGCDAAVGRSFFSLLSNDEDFRKASFVNLGYGGNNCLQAVNSLIGYGEIPSFAVINVGINGWHSIGLEEFVRNANNYLFPGEIAQLCNDFKYSYRFSWFKKFKIYKLWCYLFHKYGSIPDMKILDAKIGSELFWKELIDFREKYQDPDLMLKVIPDFIREKKEFNLDQKFYFVALHSGFNLDRMRKILQAADSFYPEKLKIVSYNIYKQLDFSKKASLNTHELMLQWGLRVLSRWGRKNNVIIFIQTYPDIKKENLGKNSFEYINNMIKLYAKLNNLEIIDHNTDSINWINYRTCYHVNDEGHRLMSKNIKTILLTNRNILLQ